MFDQTTALPSCVEITTRLLLQPYFIFSCFLSSSLYRCHDNDVVEREEIGCLNYAVLLFARLVPKTVRGSTMPFSFAIFSFLCESISCLNSSKSPKDISRSNISTSISSKEEVEE